MSAPVHFRFLSGLVCLVRLDGETLTLTLAPPDSGGGHVDMGWGTGDGGTPPSALTPTPLSGGGGHDDIETGVPDGDDDAIVIPRELCGCT